MEFQITTVEVDTKSITPTLLITAKIDYYSLLEAPLSISGKLNAGDGKTVALIHEVHASNDDRIDIGILSIADKQIVESKGTRDKYTVNLSSELSPKAIEHIELWREKDPEKAVRFNFEMVVKALEIHPEGNKPTRLRVKISRENGYFVIKQSDWVRRYSPLLGIGNFILLELEIPNKYEVSAEWAQLYDRLFKRLNEIEEGIRQGDWQKAMDRSRQFFEAIKIGDGKAGHKEFEEALKQLFVKDHHSQDGIQNLLNSIWQFFEYNSKFIHDKDKKGNLTQIPIATKEDSYLAYSFGVGLLNIIGKKIKSSNE
ncbi:MAG: hypothetical protein V4549_05810 [Bacteroidota bacterium]